MRTTTSSVRSAPATIRVERASDRAAVDGLVAEAFGDASVARLVQLIRASEHWLPDLSLVAERRGDRFLRGRVSYPSAFWETGSVGPPA